MPANYASSARPPAAADAPSAAPGPGVGVTEALPVDADARNAASIYQPFKTLADAQKWLATSAQFCPPILPVSKASGYSAVTHVGSGTGTVTPSSSVKITSGLNFVVKIIASGASSGAGAATFAVSTDGGATYGATQTCAASITDATTGITLAFAGGVGSMVLGDTYQFHSAFSPLAIFGDTTLGRFLIDHNGFPLGRYSDLREDWLMGDGTGVAMGASPPYNLGPGVSTLALNGAGGRFQLNGTASLGTIDAGINSTVGCGRFVKPTVGNTNGNKMYVQTIGAVINKAQWTVAVMEWEIYATSGTAGTTYMMGMFDNYSTMSSSTNRLWFKKLSSDTNWQWGTNSDAGDTGVVAGGGGTYPQRFRIEIHGTLSALGTAFGGALALFFVNEVLVGSSQTGIIADGTSASFGFGLESGGSTSSSLTIGPVRVVAMRQNAASPVYL